MRSQDCLQLASERSRISKCRFSPPKKWNKSRHSRLLAQVSLQWTVTTECGYTKYLFSWCLLQAISTKDTCDSDWSEPLVVTCPGAEKPLIKRIQSQQINCIRIGWERPTLRGSARVESYKVLCVDHKGAICRAIDESQIKGSWVRVRLSLNRPFARWRHFPTRILEGSVFFLQIRGFVI